MNHSTETLNGPRINNISTFQKHHAHSGKTNSNIQKIISKSNNNLLASNSDKTLPKSTSSLNRSTGQTSNHYSSINSKLNTSKGSSNNYNYALHDAAYSEATNEIFFTDWSQQKDLYLTIQNTFLTFNILLTITILGLSLWINLDARFQFVTDLGNKLLYTSLNRILSLVPIISILVASASLCLDIIQLGIYLYTRSFLNSHDRHQVDKILNIQKTMRQLSYNAYDSNILLRQRAALRYRLKVIRSNLKSITFMLVILYFLLVLAVQFFTGLFLHFNFQWIVDFELHQTYLKLKKAYERQQEDFLSRQDPMIVLFRQVRINTLEERLLDTLKAEFDCCVSQENWFDFWYRYNDLARNTNCSFHNGCLKEFVWYYVYFAVVVILATGSLRFCVQLVLGFNFQFVLMEKLMQNLYEYNAKKFRPRKGTQAKGNNYEVCKTVKFSIYFYKFIKKKS